MVQEAFRAGNGQLRLLVLIVQVGTNAEDRSDEDKSFQRPPGFPSVQPALLLELKRCAGCRPGALSCSTARPDHACRASSANMEFQANRPQCRRPEGR